MGRDNHNAGMHARPRNYKTPCDARGVWDKYAAILGSQKITVNNRNPFDIATPIQKIMQNNQVTIWEHKGQEKSCSCGGQLKYLDEILLDLGTQTDDEQLLVSGKCCVSCGRKYVVRNVLLSELKKKTSDS